MNTGNFPKTKLSFKKPITYPMVWTRCASHAIYLVACAGDSGVGPGGKKQQ